MKWKNPESPISHHPAERLALQIRSAGAGPAADVHPWVARAVLWSCLAGAIGSTHADAENPAFPPASVAPRDLEGSPLNEAERRAAENLMLRIQAKAYAQGRICTCPPAAFVARYRQTGAVIDPIAAAERMHHQAAAYAAGGTWLPIIMH